MDLEATQQIRESASSTERGRGSRMQWQGMGVVGAVKKDFLKNYVSSPLSN